ncbi:ERMIN protein, partial [Pterocles burchelli]|nr:ERMIN protein [Pterocles burchelli]
MMAESPAASIMPECNGSVPLETGPRQVIGVIDGIAKSVGMVPYTNAEMNPDAAPAKGNGEENRNSLAEDIGRGDFDGEKPCEGKVQGCFLSPELGTTTATPSTEPTGTTAARADGEPAGTTAASAGGRGDATEDEEQEEEEEEEDTEEDEVQVIEMKKENGEVPCLKQHDGGQEAPSPTSPGCNSQAEKPGEPPSLGKKNDISRHSYSRYNTISYRRIRKGNTKQRIDEFESMMHV